MDSSLKQPSKFFQVGKILGFAYFILATFSLSRVFESSRALFQGQSVWFEFALWATVLLVTMVTLAYQAYQKEKSNGSLRNPIALFDWIQEKINSKEKSK